MAKPSMIMRLDKKLVIDIGFRDRLQYTFRISMNGTISAKIMGKLIIDNTPMTLEGNTRSKLKVGRKYHSGNISEGVEKASAGSPNPYGEATAKPIRR